MKKIIESNRDEFLQEAAGTIYNNFCDKLRKTEMCNGTLTGAITFEGMYQRFTAKYYLWYAVSRREVVWQFEVTLHDVDDEKMEGSIEQWLVDVANDMVGLEVSKDNEFGNVSKAL